MDAKYESVSLNREPSPPPRQPRRDPRRASNSEDDEDLDDLHSSGSSMTEVDESLLGEDKWQKGEEDHTSQRRQQLRRRSSIRKAIFTWGRWGLDTILLLGILGLLLRQQAQQSAASKRMDFGGDFTGVGPQINQQVIRFKSDQSYAPMNTSEFFTEEVLQKWNHLMPVGMGFVWVNDTHRYHDLPTPIDWPDKTVFTTSVTHQIHCLFTIAQTYSGLTSGHPIPPDHHWHMIHCMDYMREAIMCSADLALEGHETTFPDDNGGSDGWDSKHICKDYSQVKAYLESVRAYDDQLIY